MSHYNGMEFKIIKGIQEVSHIHPEVEIVFVVEGSLYVEVKNSTYQLKKEDILLINSGLKHKLESSLDAIFCCVRYSWQLLMDMLGNGNAGFFCNSVEDKEHFYGELRQIFRELVYQDIQRPHKTNCLKESLMFRLLDCLIEEYQIEEIQEKDGKMGEDARLGYIIRYINANFSRNISQAKVAEDLYMSASSLSRFFKKQTGMYFNDYVNQVRVRYSLQELLYSEDNITKIAVDSGFSNLSIFNRVFRENYGITPSEYRKKMAAGREKQQREEQEFREALREEIKIEDLREEKRYDIKKTEVTVSGIGGELYEKTWNKAINIGSLNNLTQANLQFHLQYLVKNLGFQYVRIWSIFSDIMMISDGKQTSGFNYDKVDTVFDFLVSSHIKPFLDFGRRPDTAVKGEEIVVYFEENHIEFQSRLAWESLVLDFIKHIVRRYGQEEVNGWIFELSHDTCHMGENELYQDENYDYFDAFFYMYQIVREYVPEAEVGGMGGIIYWNLPFQRRFLERCIEEKCKPDFLSFLLFPYETELRDNVAIAKRTSKKDFDMEQVQMMKRLMREYDLENQKLYITEWNHVVSNRNYLNDSCFRSAYFGYTLSKIWDEVDLMTVRMGSDWVGSYYDTFRVVNGDCGLLTKAGIRKPAYFALDFMNHLGDYLIQKGDSYIITKTERGSYYILCFNFKWYSSNYFLREEYVNVPERVREQFTDEIPLEVVITLTDMPARQTYIVKKRTIGKEGSILDEWEKFQYEEELSGKDVKYLKEACFPRMSMEKKKTVSDTLEIRECLQAHEVRLLHIYPV